MELTFYNKAFEPIGVLDAYQSCLWVEKFRGVGDFELKVPPNSDLLELIRETRWVSQPRSKKLMWIRKHGIVTDMEKGEELIAKGFSAEVILNMRVIPNVLDVNTNLEVVVRKLLNEQFLSPSTVTRKIAEMQIPSSFSSTIAKTFTVDAVRQRQTVLDMLDDFLAAAKVGYKIEYVGGTRPLQFDIYDGVDYASGNGPGYVEFSEEYENLSVSSFTESDETRFTRAHIYGQTGQTSVMVTLDKNETGLDMREVWLDAREVESKNSAGQDYSVANYKKALTTYGQKIYGLNYTSKEYTCEVDPYLNFAYGVDYELGDLVKVDGAYGYSEVSRVTEIAYSADASKVTVVPTFAKDQDYTIKEKLD